MVLGTIMNRASNCFFETQNDSLSVGSLMLIAGASYIGCMVSFNFMLHKSLVILKRKATKWLFGQILNRASNCSLKNIHLRHFFINTPDE
jgi:hypothetical protein